MKYSIKTTTLSFITATALSLSLIPQAQAINSIKTTQNIDNNPELNINFSSLPSENQQIIARKFKVPNYIIRKGAQYIWKKYQQNKNK